MAPILHSRQTQTNHIPPQHAFANQHRGLRQEHTTHKTIRRTQRLHDTDELHAVQNHNNQARHHVKPCYQQHQYQNHHNVHIQQSQPGKNSRILIQQGLHKIHIIAVLVQMINRCKIDLIRRLIQITHIIHNHLHTRERMLVPTLQPSRRLQRRQNKQIVVLRKTRII